MPIASAGDLETLRAHVRAFLREQAADGKFIPRCDQWIQGFSPPFSRELGARGWLGMTWPRRYGGREAPPLERHAVLQELLAAGAPVAAHWMAERQTGPLLLQYGTEEQKQRLLPAIARGELYVSLGMSEPNSGSDLASVTTKATRVEDGWSVTGQKVWTSHAHRTHVLVALVRTSDERRHAGLTQMLIPLDAAGVTIRPITAITGEADFCEVFLDDVRVPDGGVIGTVGGGWRQVMSELASERSGPERFLSVQPLLAAWIDGTPDLAGQRDLGALLAELWALHCLSVSVTARLGSSSATVPMADVAIVKDRGTVFEQRLVERSILEARGGSWTPDTAAEELLRHAVLSAPSFTLRGGTNEILRTIIARDLVGGA